MPRGQMLERGRASRNWKYNAFLFKNRCCGYRIESSLERRWHHSHQRSHHESWTARWLHADWAQKRSESWTRTKHRPESDATRQRNRHSLQKNVAPLLFSLVPSFEVQRHTENVNGSWWAKYSPLTKKSKENNSPRIFWGNSITKLLDKSQYVIADGLEKRLFQFYAIVLC